MAATTTATDAPAGADEKSIQHADTASATGPVDQEKLVDETVHTDIAHGLYLESLTMDPARRDEVAKKVLKKLDYIVLPAVRPRPSPPFPPLPRSFVAAPSPTNTRGESPPPEKCLRAMNELT